MSTPPYYLLGGDIGGTNTRLQLYSLPSEGEITLIQGQKPPSAPVYGKWYRNESFPKFVDIVQHFFKDLQSDAALNLTLDGSDVSVACFAVAGPVAHNKVSFTNRADWTLDAEELASALGIKRVQLINDFVAQGYGLLSLNTATECHCLQQAPADPTAPIACIGAGTGLGECFLTRSAEGYTCYPSEGGHAEYAPRKEKDLKMLEFLRHKYESTHRISVERIVSGPGIANVYYFLAQYEPEKVDQEFHANFLQAGDLQGKVVADNAANCVLCEEAMDLFVETYGNEAGVAGLKWMPFGGLFLTGGLTPKNLDRIKDPNGKFFKAYFDKGRVSPLLKDIPLYAVLVEDLGERGAHWKAVSMLSELLRESNPTQPMPMVITSEPIPEDVAKSQLVAWGPVLVAFVGGLSLGLLLSRR